MIYYVSEFICANNVALLTCPLNVLTFFHEQMMLNRYHHVANYTLKPPPTFQVRNEYEINSIFFLEKNPEIQTGRSGKFGLSEKVFAEASAFRVENADRMNCRSFAL